MRHTAFALLDMAIVGVPALGWGIWQWVSITREIARDRASQNDEDPSPGAAGHAIGEHRLDDG
ncbi:MAG: hypothetical protein V4460_13425 [Pseudomonadota bacterium]